MMNESGLRTPRLRRAASGALLCAALGACAWLPGPPRAPTPDPRATPTLPFGVATVTPRPGPTRAIVATPANAYEAQPGAVGVGDVFYPDLGNGGYDALDYTIDLSVDVASNVLAGTTTMVARATQTLNAFNLDLFGLEVLDVTLNGRPARYNRSGAELTVTPLANIAADSRFTSTVRYRGTPTVVSDAGIPRIPLGWQKQITGTFVVSEPSGAMNWYPVNNHPRDKASYTFRITVPGPYQVAANGVLVDRFDAANGASTWIWRMAQPMASYLATVHIGLYDVETSAGPRGLPIRNYFPMTTPGFTRRQFDKTAEMIAFMEEKVAPYPFDEYGVVLLTSDSTWALETQTLSIFGARGAGEDTIFHELAHQWFGDNLTPAQWQDTWLNEGFATYYSALWQERTRGKAYFESVMRSHYNTMAGARLGPPYVREVDQLFGGSVYLRGALTLHALRVMVGETNFDRTMREYYKRYQGGVASTEDFLATVTEVAGAAPSAALRPWIFDVEMPPYPN